LGLVVGIGALFFWSRNNLRDDGESSAVATRDLELQRQRLLADIARLDQEHAANREDSSYLSARRRLFDQAVDLTRLLEAREHGQ
jgi:hypothetical protein